MAGGNRYPFVDPSTDDERFWWDEMRRMAREGGPTTRVEMAERLKRWAPVLRCMTPGERLTFHEERRAMAGAFTWDLDGVRGEGERMAAEDRLFESWQARVAGRA